MAIRLIAMDLDGTLTEHKTPLCDKHREILSRLSKKYKLLMVGAGTCRRIFEQLGRFPIDIIGNYGMQIAEYDATLKDINIVFNATVPCNRESVAERADRIRQRHALTEFRGESVEYHTSGCVTIALLGTKALQEDKLAFDPDRSRRRAFYSEVCELFSDYNVFIGGSSSFDMAPAPYNKRYALEKYCDEHGYEYNEVAYIGDDYGMGGNDESVYLSDINFIKIDDYTTFPEVVAHLL